MKTTIQQSQRLLELGLDPKTADCGYFRVGGGDEWFPFIIYYKEKEIENKVDLFGEENVVVSWSLDALLGVMRKLNVVVTLQMTELATWLRIKDLGFIWQKDIHVKDPMDAVYGGMLWLFEQGLIKKEDKK